MAAADTTGDIGFVIIPNAVYNIREVAPKIGLDYWHLQAASQAGELKLRNQGITTLALGSNLLAWLDGEYLVKRKVTRKTKDGGTEEVEVTASASASDDEIAKLADSEKTAPAAKVAVPTGVAVPTSK